MLKSFRLFWLLIVEPFKLNITWYYQYKKYKEKSRFLIFSHNSVRKYNNYFKILSFNSLVQFVKKNLILKKLKGSPDGWTSTSTKVVDRGIDRRGGKNYKVTKRRQLDFWREKFVSPMIRGNERRRLNERGKSILRRP